MLGQFGIRPNQPYDQITPKWVYARHKLKTKRIFKTKQEKLSEKYQLQYDQSLSNYQSCIMMSRLWTIKHNVNDNQRSPSIDYYNFQVICL